MFKKSCRLQIRLLLGWDTATPGTVVVKPWGALLLAAIAGVALGTALGFATGPTTVGEYA